MMFNNALCPGSKAFKEPRPEEYPCQECDHQVEIWTHELKATCPNCGATVFRERAPSCIDWCQYAKECVGEELYTQLTGEKE